MDDKSRQQEPDQPIDAVVSSLRDDFLEADEEGGILEAPRPGKELRMGSRLRWLPYLLTLLIVTLSLILIIAGGQGGAGEANTAVTQGDLYADLHPLPAAPPTRTPYPTPVYEQQPPPPLETYSPPPAVSYPLPPTPTFIPFPDP